MPANLERRIKALEGARMPQEEHQQLNEGFARIQSAGIAVPEPTSGESLKAWLRRFSDAQLIEVQTWLEADVAHGATTI